MGRVKPLRASENLTTFPFHFFCFLQLIHLLEEEPAKAKPRKAMLGSSLRRVRRLWSSSSFIITNNSCSLETSKTSRIIHLPSSSASKCLFNNINISKNYRYYNCFSTAATSNVTASLSSKKNVCRTTQARGRQRRRVIKNNSNGKTNAYAAIELALDSVVKIFTVSSSPNYALPWQNKSQRESTGSGL